MSFLEFSALWVLCVYILSAFGVIHALDKLHFKKDLTWLEAFVLYDRYSLMLFVWMPLVNTTVALAMLLEPSKFDRVDDE